MSPQLISRFKEREENVKSDIFHVYISLLRQTKHMTAVLPDTGEVSTDHPVTLLTNQLPGIVRAVTRQLREKSFKTRQVKMYISRVVNFINMEFSAPRPLSVTRPCLCL